MSSRIFNENVCIITGASTGIGAELAYQLAAQGAWLSLAARSEAKLIEVADKCKKLGARAVAIVTDVSVENQCKALIDKTVETYGRIDTLINNAGITMVSYFDQITDLEIAERVMKVNYFGTVYCTYYALPHLKQTAGRILGINSLTGLAGVPTRTVYSASKHAMVGFFDSLRIELSDFDVSVTNIFPGFIETEIRKNGLNGDGSTMGVDPIKTSKSMTAKECAAIIIKAAGQRKRQEIMTFKGKAGKWLKLIFPGMIDRIAKNTIKRGG